MRQPKITFPIGERIADTRLTPIGLIKLARANGGNWAYECKCDCGTNTVQSISNLRTGKVKSCGCFNLEKARNQTYTVEKARKAFMEKVVRLPNGCWQWVGCKNPDGYGSVTYRGKTMSAHRAAWIIRYGVNPSLQVLHRCDVPACVNPDHLFLGTQGDNVRDCVTKGRYSNGGREGEKHAMTPFTTTDILIIRELAHSGESRSSIARKYSVSRTSIDAIVNRKTWKHT